MKKHFVLILLCTVFFIQKSNSQVNNLSDFLYLSELSEYGLTDYLQSNWELHTPTEIIKKGKVKSVYTFTYNYNQKKQVLKRVINMDLKTAYKIRSTTFISDDLPFLERVKKSLSSKEFFEVGVENKKTLYEDGNRMLVIERDFHKKANGLYKITIMFKDNFIAYAVSQKNTTKKPVTNIESKKVRLNQEWKIKGVKEGDLGTFNLKIYKDWSCNIELNIKEKKYKSIKCNSDNETATLVSKKDTLKIEYSIPELVDANIDILGNEIGFDYFSTDEDNSIPVQDKSLALPLKTNKLYNGYGNSRVINQTRGRKVFYKPKDNGSSCNEKGKIVLLVQVDRAGNYKSANITKGTTNTNPCLIKHSIQLAKKYKWQQKPNGNIIESTVLTFNYE